MLSVLSVLSSRFGFSNSNYNYTNTNTNVSSHLSTYCSINPAHMAKNNDNLKSAGTYGERDLLEANA
jgi:hypothetical protein